MLTCVPRINGPAHIEWKMLCTNAMGPLDIYFEGFYPANFVLWRWLRSAFRRLVCKIDCGRGKGMWKCTSPKGAIHNTMSE